MAWPSTKASTSNVDAGSDSPSSARADIKQNIDNVNSIIDEFDIASPSNGDILTYNSTSGAWEPGAAASGGTSVAIIGITSGEELVSGSTYRAALTEDFDPSGIVSLNGSYQITLTAGTYAVKLEPFGETDDEAPYVLYNETDSSIERTFTGRGIATTTDALYSGTVVISPGSTKNFSFRQTDVTSTNRNSTPKFYIYK